LKILVWASEVAPISGINNSAVWGNPKTSPIQENLKAANFHWIFNEDVLRRFETKFRNARDCLTILLWKNFEAILLPAEKSAPFQLV